MSAWEVSRLGDAPVGEDPAGDDARGVAFDPEPLGANDRSTPPQAKAQGRVSAQPPVQHLHALPPIPRKTERALIGDLARKIVASAGIPKNADSKALAESVDEALNKLVTELATRTNAPLSLGKDLSGRSLDGRTADARFGAEVAAAIRSGTLKLDVQAATLIAEARLSALSSTNNPAGGTLAFQDHLAQRLAQLISLEPRHNVTYDTKQHLLRPVTTGPTFEEKLRVVQLVMNASAVIEGGKSGELDIARLAGLLLAAIGSATKRPREASSSENVVLTAGENSALSDAVMTSEAVLAMPQNRRAQAQNFPAALAPVIERQKELAAHPDDPPPAKDWVWLKQHMADAFVLGNPDAKTIPLPTSRRQLENVIGRALGLAPDKEPKTADEFDLDRRGEWSWYTGDNLKAIHQISDSIQRFRKKWGPAADQASLTALPLIIDRKDSFDPRQSVLWRITLPSGRDYFIDITGKIYDGLQDFFDHNPFPEGQISVPLDGHVKLDFTGYVELQTNPQTESGWHRGLQIGGLAVGAALICFSEGLATPEVLWLGTVLGIVGLAEHGYTLHDRATHYQVWAPGKETLLDYLGIISSLAGIGAGSLGLSALSAVSNETSNAAQLMNLAKIAGGVTYGTNVVTTGISAPYLYRNWNILAPGEKATALIGMLESGAGLVVGARAWTMNRPKITAGEDGLYTVEWRQGGPVTMVLRKTADCIELVKLDGAVSPTTGGRLLIAAQRLTGLRQPKISLPAPVANTGSSPIVVVPELVSGTGSYKLSSGNTEAAVLTTSGPEPTVSIDMGGNVSGPAMRQDGARIIVAAAGDGKPARIEVWTADSETAGRLAEGQSVGPGTPTYDALQQAARTLGADRVEIKPFDPRGGSNNTGLVAELHYAPASAGGTIEPPAPAAATIGPGAAAPRVPRPGRVVSGGGGTTGARTNTSTDAVGMMVLDLEEDAGPQPRITASRDDPERTNQNLPAKEGATASEGSTPAAQTGAGSGGEGPPPLTPRPPAAEGDAGSGPLPLWKMPEAWFKVMGGARPTVQIVKLQAWDSQHGPDDAQVIAAVVAKVAAAARRIPDRIEVYQLDPDTQQTLNENFSNLRMGISDNPVSQSSPKDTAMGRALLDAARRLGLKVEGVEVIEERDGTPIGLAMPITSPDAGPGPLRELGFPWVDDESGQLHWWGRVLDRPDTPLQGPSGTHIAWPENMGHGNMGQGNMALAYWSANHRWEYCELRFDPSRNRVEISNLHLAGGLGIDNRNFLADAVALAKEKPSTVELSDIRDPSMLADLHRTSDLAQTVIYQLFENLAARLGKQINRVEVTGTWARPNIVVHLR